MITVRMTVSTTNEIPMRVSGGGVDIDAQIGATYVMAHAGNTYEGLKTVTPNAHRQVLPTEGCYMTEDIYVEPIPKNYGLITYDGSCITVS